MSESKKRDVVIVGSGTGALVLALELAKKGLRIAMIDRQTGPAASPRGEILQPNGLKILDRIGLLPDLLNLDVHRNHRVYFHQSAGPRLCAIDYKTLPPPYSYSLILLPALIQNLLLEKIASFSNVEIFWGAAFQSIVRKNEEGVRLGAAYQGSKINFRAPIIIGADGVYSAVRGALGIRNRLQVYSDAYLTMVVDRPLGFQDESYYYLGRRSIFGFFPVSQHKLYFFYMIPSGSFDRIREKGLNRFKEDLLALNPETRAFLEVPLKSILSWETVSYMPCFKVWCERWIGDGAALLGDAAHAMNPHVAQGRNGAMEDGVILAEVIEDCFRKGDFSRRSLSAYERARRPSTEVLQRLGDEMTWLWNSGWPPLVWVRERIFRSLQRNQSLHDKILMTITGLKVVPLQFGDRLRALFWA